MKTAIIKIPHSPGAKFTGLDQRANHKFKRLYNYTSASFHGLVKCIRLDEELCLSLFKFTYQPK